MTGVEVAVLAGGLLVIVGGWALAYRYTISPKAGERMAEANRKYRPRAVEHDPVTWRRLAILWAAWIPVRLVASELWWPLTVAVAILGLGAIYLIVRSHKRRQEGRGEPG